MRGWEHFLLRGCRPETPHLQRLQRARSEDDSSGLLHQIGPPVPYSGCWPGLHAILEAVSLVSASLSCTPYFANCESLYAWVPKRTSRLPIGAQSLRAYTMCRPLLPESRKTAALSLYRAPTLPFVPAGNPLTENPWQQQSQTCIACAYLQYVGRCATQIDEQGP